MKKQDDIHLAYLIIHLDLLRDELFEELIHRLGNKAHALLRAAQNSI